MQLYHARRRVKKENQGNHAKSYDKLPAWAKFARVTNSGSVVKMEVDARMSANPLFKRFFVCFDAMKKGFVRGCRPWFGIDGCHLKGTYGGVLLSAVAIDGNKGMFQIAFAMVEVECMEFWKFFLHLLNESLASVPKCKDHPLVRMARKKENGVFNVNQGIYRGGTLREEKTGPKQVDVSSILKVQHLQRLATWASGEARMGPLAAFLGEHLAASAEASGIPLDSTTLLCETSTLLLTHGGLLRCKTILQPGINCTIRIEKVNSKRRCAKKLQLSCQNNVVYTCHFCSHPNIKWGTAKGQVHALLASQKSNSCESTNGMKGNSSNEIPVTIEIQHNAGSKNSPKPELKPESNATTSEAAVRSISSKSPVTPLMKLVNKSNNKKKVSGSTPNKVGSNSAIAISETTIGGSSKRRRKGWSSLKEIVQINESQKDKSISNFAIPFQI
ncbi:hypothetical protein Cni_G22088 [Canna indica]|uniref:MULE transposase domain-containing protein n=1 Tax=Canna indica TaxID=4628 RepID=A0AAQ3QKW5_9LILI|nr:hypothetical protein Cni_G22088 [Canna indica]